MRCLLACAATLIFAAADAHAEIVRDWQNSANYPSRITGIQFGNAWLRTGAPVRFGAWTITLDGPQPRAEVNMNMRVLIDAVCSNRELPTEKCLLEFVFAGDRQGQCNAVSRVPSQSRWPMEIRIHGIRIPCPTVIDFAR